MRLQSDLILRYVSISQYLPTIHYHVLKIYYILYMYSKLICLLLYKDKSLVFLRITKQTNIQD